MIGVPFQLFIVRSKQSFADKDKTLASFINKYFVVDPMLVDSIGEINDHRNKTYPWYGVVQDCEYIEEQLVRQVHDFMRRGGSDFLICYKVLPFEGRIIYQPRFVRPHIKLRSNWDVEDRRPLPYVIAKLHRGFILDHNVRCDDATRDLIR